MAVDHNAYLLACRARALTLQVCSTGAITMSATATGYTRTDGGDFNADQFAVGMEFVASGFTKSANNGARVVTSISADGKSVSGPGCVAESAQSGKTLSVGFPSDLVRANIKYTRTPGKTFAKEQYIPGPSSQVTLGPLGEIELFPMYSVSFLVPDETGELAASRYVNAMMALFAPRTAIPLASGEFLRVRTDTGPYPGQLLPAESGFASQSFAVPLWIRTPNSI